MKYALLIYDREGSRPEPETEAFGDMMKGYFALNEELESQGVMRGGAGLSGVETATTVRVRDGRTSTTDGPFAETKEQLGGFYLVECDNLDEAIAWASKIPTARWGTVEVRPVMEFDKES